METTVKMRAALMLVLAATTGCAGTNHAERHSQAQEVLGTVAIAFIPVDSASVPRPPIDLTLHLKEHRNGKSATADIADGSAVWDLMSEEKGGFVVQNFRLLLPPGEYSLSGFGVRATSLSDGMFFLPWGGLKFTVPEDRCIYVGRITPIYFRLAPGSLEEAKAAGLEVSASVRAPLMMTYLPQGALLLWNVLNVLPGRLPDGDRTRMSAYSQQVLGLARQQQCMFLMEPDADDESPASDERRT